MNRTMASDFATGVLTVVSPDVQYGTQSIESTFDYTSVAVDVNPVTRAPTATPVRRSFVLSTQREVPKVGVMIVGWGGNNGSTVTGALIAHKLRASWRTKEGTHVPDYLGSLTQASTVRLGSTNDGRDVYVPFSSLLPMVAPADLVIGGWDISAMDLAGAMARAAVLDIDLQRQIAPAMAELKPLPAIFYPDFIAANQSDRADNTLPGNNKAQHLEAVRGHIRDFKTRNGVDKVIVLWSANTERYAEIIPGINDTADALLASIARSESEVSPSTVYAVAAALEGCTYINGSPQNTFVPGVIELAQRTCTFLAGDDFKSGQVRGAEPTCRRPCRRCLS